MQISKVGGQTVSNDIETMFRSVDTALLDTLRLSGSVMETNAVSTIPPARLQGALDSMAAGFTKMVESRKDMIQMQRKLIALKGESNLREVGFGCYKVLTDGIFGSAEDRKVEAAA